MPATVIEAHTEELMLLGAAAKGTLPKAIVRGETSLPFDRLQELCDGGLMKADYFPGLQRKDHQLSNVTITHAGRERLAELEANRTNDKAHHGKGNPKLYGSANDVQEKLLGKIAIGAASTVLAAFALYALGHYFGLLK